VKNCGEKRIEFLGKRSRVMEIADMLIERNRIIVLFLNEGRFYPFERR